RNRRPGAGFRIVAEHAFGRVVLGAATGRRGTGIGAHHGVGPYAGGAGSIDELAAGADRHAREHVALTACQLGHLPLRILDEGHDEVRLALAVVLVQPDVEMLGVVADPLDDVGGVIVLHAQDAGTDAVLE